NGRTALHCASLNGSKEVVEALLRARADMAAKDTGGWTALHYASLNGSKEVVEALLRAKADMAAKDTPGNEYAKDEIQWWGRRYVKVTKAKMHSQQMR
ncbi:Palmitoyltransferase AKR1, partial [Tetrabaena socialis]